LSYYLFVDGGLLGVVDPEQREELELEHLRGVEFVPVVAEIEACVRDLRQPAGRIRPPRSIFAEVD